VKRRSILAELIQILEARYTEAKAYIGYFVQCLSSFMTISPTTMAFDLTAHRLARRRFGYGRWRLSILLDTHSTKCALFPADP